MKKLICLLFVLLLLPCAAFASESIVASWYMLYDKSACPEIASNFQNMDLIVSAYSFLDDGSIMLSENDIKDKSGTFVSSIVGKWERGFIGYTYNIIGFGSGKCFVEDDLLYLQLNDTNIYLTFRRMIPLDPYRDYVSR